MSNAKGLITQQREHKAAYFTVQPSYKQLDDKISTKQRTAARSTPHISRRAFEYQQTRTSQGEKK